MRKGRFAPTPSGEMHLGNAFTALLAWLSVRSQGGKMVLRMEDLDPLRCKDVYVSGVIYDLRWLGLDWDEGPFFQSRRTEFYQAILDQLCKDHLLYECFCSRDQLHAPNAPHNAEGEPIYPGTCRRLTAEERREQRKIRPPALRIRVPKETIFFTDGKQGTFSEQLDSDCGDFILRRSDGVFAYQLAVVADDAEMGITEVVRGRDLLSSTPRQIWLQRQFGFSTPSYCHTPLLLAPDGRRLSKRDADLSLAALRARGVPAEEIVGKLAHLAGLIDRPEPLRPLDLIDIFDWNVIPTADLTLRTDARIE